MLKCITYMVLVLIVMFSLSGCNKENRINEFDKEKEVNITNTEMAQASDSSSKEVNEIVSNNSENKFDYTNVRKAIQDYLNLVAAEECEPSRMISELGLDLTIDYNNHDVEFFNKTNIKYDDFKKEMLKYVSESWFENRFAKSSDPDIETFYKNVNGVLYIANIGSSGRKYEVKNVTQLEESYFVEYTVILDTMISGTYKAKFNIDSPTYLITYCEL